MNSIKFLISSQGWADLCKEIDKISGNLKDLILEEANEETPNLDKLRKLSADREATLLLKELPAELLLSAEELED